MSDTTTAVTSLPGEKRPTEIRIIVNGGPEEVESDVVSYEQVVHLAYPTPPSPDTLFSVTFRNAEEPREGSLAAGGTVRVKKHGTIFNVKATGKS